MDPKPRSQGLSRARMRQKGNHSFRPAFERLENLTLLATVSWTNPNSGSWATPGNWSTGQVPGPDDDVVINVPGASPTVTIGGMSETQVNINAYVNSNLRTYTNGTDYPLGGTHLTVGGVSFTLANHAGGGTGVIQTPSGAAPSSFDIPVNIAHPTTVYLLINSTTGTYGETVGSVEFKATQGQGYSVNLVEGQDIRDHNNGVYNNTIGQGALGGYYLGTASYGGGQVRFDELGFVLPDNVQQETLTDIILHGTGQNPAGCPFLAAATVAAGNPAFHSLTAADPLVISGAKLNLAASSTISGPLTFVDGGLWLTGGTTQITGGPVTSTGAGVNGSGTLLNTSRATLDLTGGHTVNYTGSFTGGGTGGSGIVIQGGEVAIGPGVTTFRFSSFPSPGFPWTGGTIAVQNGGTLVFPQAIPEQPVTISGQEVLTESPGGTIQFGGDLLATTTNPAQVNLQGTVLLIGGVQATPKLLEAVSQDLGSSPAAFQNNSAFGTLTLVNRAYVKLVDQSDNAPGTGAEAVYANSLIVPANATLDLNGLHLYVRNSQINGTIKGGSITYLTPGGPLALGSPTPGSLPLAGQVDNWTFFERGGHTLTIALDPGSGMAGGPISPSLQWAQVQLLDPSKHVLATANSTTAGAILTLKNIALLADGTYTIVVKAAPGHASSVGSYVVAAYDLTTNDLPLDVNQITAGNLPTPYSTVQWTLSAAANTQVKFVLLAASAVGLSFSLTGPNQFSGFTNITGSSAVVTLPSSGTYTLTAQGTGGATGRFTFEMVETSLTPLTLGTPFDGTFVGSGQPQWFVVTLPEAAPLLLRLTDAAASDHVELYARFNGPPTRQLYDYAANGAGSSPSLLIPAANAGTWYVLVYATYVAAAPRPFTLDVDASPVVVTSVTPVQYGADAVATLTLNGAGFTTMTSVALVAPDQTTVYPASTVAFDTFTKLTATVDLSGVPAGVYSIRATNTSGGSATLTAAFTVTAAGPANLQTRLILPAAVGRHISSTFYVEYSNTGTVAMPAPVLLLESSVPFDRPLFTLDKSLVVPGFWTSAIPQGYSTTAQILASGKVPGVLEPGESVTVPVYYAGMLKPWDLNELQFRFDLRIFTTTDQDPVDWGSLQSSLQPAGTSNLAWSIIYGALTAQLGNTWGGYVQLLDNEASYLGGLGEVVTDVNALWGFAVQQADNALNPIGPTLASATDDSVAIPGSLSLSFTRVFAGTIAGRDATGPLGFGWSTPWQTTATAASDGTVTITGTAGSRRIFQPDSRKAGVFFSQPGDTGTLKSDGQGGSLLTEADGTVTDYNPNSTLKYRQDPNGNRIIAGYTGGRLTSLTASSGQSITIGYNAAGLISTVADFQGRVTTYTYDSSNQHLIAVTGFNGQTTSYEYDATDGSAAQNSLTSITFPGGTHRYFTYDTQGRLASTSNDGGAQPETFAYSLGRVSVTDGTSDTANLYYNEQGLVVKSIDPLGNVTLNTYDGNFNLASFTNAVGQSETFTYNAARQVTSFRDFLGNTTTFRYSGPFHELASMTDANGNTTSYAYSSSGDLLDTTYADGTSESFTYDPEGDATSFINANGQPIQYAYNAAGQVTTETFSDGSTYNYTYDGLGNLVTATDATGTTTLTYDPTSQMLTKVAYPNDTSLTFTYGAAGRRESMVDQTGFTVNYSDDSVGRLSQLTDGGGNPIVTYTYDAAGRLSRKSNSNGTTTTYQYDPDGNVLHLINLAPDGAINSRFDYTYDALGRETAETTIDGTWTYSYDPDGQLIHAVFASTNPTVPGQDLAYTYDAVGNRLTSVINGATTSYQPNNMNEYASVGGVPSTYDADGNLTSDGTNTYTYNSLNRLTGVTGPGGTTTYTYNALGQRVASTAGGQTTQYLIDPAGLGNTVGIYTGSGTVIASYIYGLGLTSQVTSSGTDFYDFDNLGSTADLTSSTGSVINRYGYLPFGGLMVNSAAIQNPFTFVGQLGVMQTAGQLYDMRAREYSSSTGQFLSVNPLGLRGGDVNLRRFVGNDPVNGLDPSGRGGAFFHLFAPVVFLTSSVPREDLAITGSSPEVPESVAQLIARGAGNADAFAEFQGALETLGGNSALLSGGNHLAQSLSAGLWSAPNLLPLAAEAGQSFGGLHGPYVFSAGILWPTEVGPEPPPPHVPIPVPPGGRAGGNGGSGSVGSKDPNAMIGPSGYGAPNYVTSNGAVFPYEIDFENASAATAPAQGVTITDQLDSSLDWDTFQLTRIRWGDTVLSIPAGSQHYQTTISMTFNGQTFDVLVEAGIHGDTGQVYATFQSIDPTTMLPPDVLTGFLPPEDGTGRGMGDISFTIQPKAGAATGTAIRNVALITFDTNPAIATDQVNDDDPSQGVDPTRQALVTLDAVAPTSRVTALPVTETSASFLVSWAGSDDVGGSGIASYDVYVSDNGGAYTLWQSDTTQNSATFPGTNHHSYAFFSVARDNAGNVEATPVTAQATTQVHIPAVDTTPTVQATRNPATLGDSITFTVTVNPAQPTNGTPTGTVQLRIDGTDVGAPVTLVDGAASFPPVMLGVGQHSVSAVYTNDNEFFHPGTGNLPGGEVVNPAGVTVVVASSAQESHYGQSLTFMATIKALTAGLPTPGGTVQFQADGAPFGGPVNLVDGHAVSPSIGTLSAGAHIITAFYSQDPNYRPNSGSTSQTVDKAHLTVTADAESKVYGAGVPTLDYAITGFINADTTGVVRGVPGLATTAGAASGVGTYPITVGLGTLSAANYDFPQLVPGMLRVTPAPLTIQADDQARAMGQPNPPLTASYFGLVNGDGPSSLTSPPVLATTADTTSPAGVYPITVGGAESSNYAITFLTGSLTVTATPLVTMTTVQPVFNKKHQVIQILVGFSGALDGAEAANLANYRLTAAGKKGSFTAKNAKLITLRTAAYDAAHNTITLTPLKPYSIKKPVQLRIVGQPPSGLEDRSGRLIDGNHDGRPGGDAIALLGRGGASVSAVIDKSVDPQAVIDPSAIDALLERGDVWQSRRSTGSNPRSHR